MSHRRSGLTTGAHFESLEDVERYFASRGDLALTPIPPAELWERLDQQRRESQKTSTPLRIPAPPAPRSLAINFSPPVRRRKSYVLKPVKRVRTTVTVKRRTRKTHYSLKAPMSWKDLL